MEPPGRDGRDSGQPRRHGDLAGAIVAPTDDRAVRLEGEAEAVARSDGPDAGQACGHRGLAVGVLTPGDDRAIRLEGEAVEPPCGDGRDTRLRSRRNAGLAVAVVAPGHHRAGRLQRHAEAHAARDGRDPRQAGRHRGLAGAVAAPCGDLAGDRRRRSGDAGRSRLRQRSQADRGESEAQQSLPRMADQAAAKPAVLRPARRRHRRNSPGPAAPSSQQFRIKDRHGPTPALSGTPGRTEDVAVLAARLPFRPGCQESASAETSPSYPADAIRGAGLQ